MNFTNFGQVQFNRCRRFDGRGVAEDAARIAELDIV